MGFAWWGIPLLAGRFETCLYRDVGPFVLRIGVRGRPRTFDPRSGQTRPFPSRFRLSPESRGFVGVTGCLADRIRPVAIGCDELVGGVGAPGALFVGVELGGQFGFPCLDVRVDDGPRVFDFVGAGEE